MLWSSSVVEYTIPGDVRVFIWDRKCCKKIGKACVT